jgi:hypothetical protein
VESDVLQAHLDTLCPELAAVVADASASGNRVVETWTGFGQAVRLDTPAPVLSGIADDVRAKLVYRSVGDPHYWLGEIHCRMHPGWFVALPFGRTGSSDHPDLPRIR